jgi:hypothetical protein
VKSSLFGIKNLLEIIDFRPSNLQHFAIQYPTHSIRFQALIFLFLKLLIKLIAHFLFLLKIIRINLIFNIHIESVPSA